MLINKRRITIDTSTEDITFIETFKKDLEMLTGMCNEMFVENKVMLLSPVLRELLSDKAVVVKNKFDKIKWRLYVDNPGENLQ